MEERSGVKFTEAQVALARLWIGNSNPSGNPQDTVRVTKPPTGDGLVASSGNNNDSKNSSKPEIEEIKPPRSVEEARDIINRFENAARQLRSDEDVSDNVSQHALLDRTSLFDEKWLGSEEEERFW